MRVALLGLGLIGGSVARGLAGGKATVAAWSPSGAGAAAALADGTIAEASPGPEEAIAGADIVILAAPPLECLTLLGDLAGTWGPALGREATVTDVASTKAAIVGRADELGLAFVGGHPMAGRESSGYAAASPDLFVGRPWVVVRGAAARDRDVERVTWLAETLGARPVPMTAEEHDAAVAAISHLPLLVSAALVEAVALGDGRGGDPDILGRLASTGWRDTTRLARGDVAMGAGILATNAGPVAAALAWFRAVLGGWAAELERPGGPDAGGISDRLAAAQRALRAMDRTAGDPGATEPGPADGTPVDRTRRA